MGVIESGECNLNVVEQAIWCLGNISGDSVLFRDNILAMGAIEKICFYLDKAPAGSSLVRNASWTLANFGKGKPMIDIDIFKPAIFSLAKVLRENDNQEILSDIVWAFSYVTDEGGDDTIIPFIESQVTQRLLQLLNHPNNLIAVPALRTLGNILTASDELTETVLDLGVLE